VDRRTVLRRFTILGFIGFTLVVIGVFVRQGWIAEKAHDEVRHSYEVREQIDHVLAKVKDLEIGQRGYALSGDSLFLEPYLHALHGGPSTAAVTIESMHGSESTVWEILGQLKELVEDNPEQLARAESLEVLVHQRVAYADSMIHLRQTAGIEAAVSMAKLGEGRRIMNDTRALVDSMYVVEALLLRQRENLEHNRARANSWLLYAVIGLFYVAWLISLRLAARSRRRRLRAEKDLRESNQLLQATIHSGSHAIFSTDLDGKILLFNSAAERMLGYSAKELIGQQAGVALRGIHDRDQLERRRKRFEKRLGHPVRGMDLFLIPPAPGERPDPTWDMVRKNGERFLASMVVSPMIGPDGTQQGYLCIVRDVTERRTMEHKVAESNALLNAVVHGIDYGVYVADAQGILRILSRGGERMMGYKAEDFVGKPVLEVTANIFLPEEMAARAGRIVKQYGRPPEGIEIFNLPLDDDGPFGQEWTNIRADGSRLTVAVTVAELRGDDGKVQGSVAIARDITQLKANERLKNEFISTVSHELRTPLTSIRGALGLIAGGAAGPLPEGAREMINIAHRNSERLVHIINDILDIDKIDSGKLTLYPKPLEAGAFLRQAADAHGVYGEKHGVRFVVGSVPEDTWFTADPDRLMQVLANLLSNAAKFSPSGSEVLLDAASLGTMVRVYVRDHGTGIPEAFRARIFEKFAQAEGTDARRYEGTGLGLSITRKLVEAMGGNIGFDSEPGQGTTFYFDLPKSVAPAAGDVSSKRDDRLRVLICEDDADVGTLLRVLLERAGLAADVVYTLADARAQLATGAYAALTLDLMLPDGSGLTLLRALRREAATRGLPVIVISARAEEGRRELNGDAIGMIDWITKPIDEDRLAASMRRAIEGSEGGSAAFGRPRVLHVEDDADFRKVLAQSLGESAEWIGAATLAEADALVARERFDLVVLDIDLPDGSGLELLEKLKTHPGGPVPVLILSASETDNGIRERVETALVKSRLSEERIVETILAQIRKAARAQGKHPT
jgi:PAS domain S-box-containing protein